MCGGEDCAARSPRRATRRAQQNEDDEEEPTQTSWTTGDYSTTTATITNDIGDEERRQQEVHVIELMGGVFMPLRLTQETEKAWSMNRHSEAFCFVCETRVACVDDCDSFICPECLSIVPLERTHQNEFLGDSLSWSVPHRGGVGTGLKIG